MGCQPSKAGEVVVEVFDPATGPNFNDLFELRHKLGEGAYGTVYSACGPASGKDERVVAVKVVDLRGPKTDHIRLSQRMAVAKEARVLRALPKSANVVEFHGAYFTAGCAYFVTEKCDMGLWPAFQRLPAHTEEAFRPLLMHMMSGVAACHAAGVVHRDIKFDNFLAVVTQTGRIIPKLCDFGLSSCVLSPESNELHGVCGTPPFLAPEVVGSERFNAKVDVWAMGALAHVLFFGRWPYTPSPLTVETMKEAIRIGLPLLSFKPSLGMPAISKPCSAWVQALLTRCPAKRPSAQKALLDGDLAATWSVSTSLSPALEAAWRCGVFEAPVNEQPLTELDKYIVQLNVARNMRSDPTRSVASAHSSRSSSSKSTSASMDPPFTPRI